MKTGESIIYDNVEYCYISNPDGADEDFSYISVENALKAVNQENERVITAMKIGFTQCFNDETLLSYFMEKVHNALDID